jgi:NAD(P)H-nitrite reductase large subunit
VAPLFEQGKVCSTHLAQFGIGRYVGSQTSTKLKVTGIDLFSAGDFTGGKDTEQIVLSDPFGGVYRKVVIQGDRLVGACLYGVTVDGSWYFMLLRDGRSINAIRDKLMFGESNIGDVGHEGHSKAASRVDSDEVCGWEIYIAGNGGIKTEVAHLFVKLKTAEEVLEYSGAFRQLYREQRWYLERTVHDVNRVGLDHVKKQIFDDAESRRALRERLQFSLDGEPDPWFEFEKAAVDTRQFKPVGVL